MLPTFEDRYGRKVTYLRVSVTDRCNFRCVYCMPEEGIEHVARPELLTFRELVDLVTIFAQHGVTRVRLTGGEPLVRADICELVGLLRDIDGIDEVVMTTNAFLLARYAATLQEAGLTGLNISFDSTRPETFKRLTRIGDMQRVIDGIRAAKAAGIERVKLNAVVIGGENDDELTDLVEFAHREGTIMRFIEFMPIGGETGWGREACVTARQMRARLAERWDLQPDERSYGTGPARYWRARGDGLGADGAIFGIISAVTECFCSDCNRVRITPQGGLRACLADDRETALRDAMRLAPTHEDGLVAAEQLIRAALFGKKESHAFDLDGGAVTQKSMTAIGG